jgi:hypothetical protein
LSFTEVIKDENQKEVEKVDIKVLLPFFAC